MSGIRFSFYMYDGYFTGHFMCEHCKKSGSWLHLKDNITALNTIRKNK